MKSCFIICLCLVLSTPFLEAKDKPEQSPADQSLQELDEVQQEIEEIEKELESIQQLLNSVRQLADTRESTVIQLENEKKNLEERLNRLYEAKTTKENELKWVEDFIIQKEADIHHNQSLLEEIVKGLGNLYSLSAYGDTDAQNQLDMQNCSLCADALLHNIDSLFQAWSMAIQNRHLTAQNIGQITSQIQRTKDTYSKATEQYKIMAEEVDFLAKVEKGYQAEAEELMKGKTSLENFLAQREANKRGRNYTFEFTEPLIWPIKGEILSEFGENTTLNNSLIQNQGIFIKAPKGTPVKCVASGVVAFAGWFENKGNLVIIDHQNGFYSLYGYNDKLLVHKGGQVSRGQIIAYSGESRINFGTGLWFELRKSGKAVNPQDYLPKMDN